METRISSSSMDNANKIKTSVMLLLLYGICIFPAWDGNLSVLLGLFAVSSILCMLTRGFMPNRFIVDGEKLVIDAYLVSVGCLVISDIFLLLLSDV